jgi:hypothetical protein
MLQPNVKSVTRIQVATRWGIAPDRGGSIYIYGRPRWVSIPVILARALRGSLDILSEPHRNGWTENPGYDRQTGSKEINALPSIGRIEKVGFGLRC